MFVHVKNISETRAFFAPLNRYLKPNEIIDVLKICEGNKEMAVKLVGSYENHAQIQVFVVHDSVPTPEGVAQEEGLPFPVMEPSSDERPEEYRSTEKIEFTSNAKKKRSKG